MIPGPVLARLPASWLDMLAGEVCTVAMGVGSATGTELVMIVGAALFVDLGDGASLGLLVVGVVRPISMFIVVRAGLGLVLVAFIFSSSALFRRSSAKAAAAVRGGGSKSEGRFRLEDFACSDAVKPPVANEVSLRSFMLDCKGGEPSLPRAGDRGGVWWLVSDMGKC